MLPLTRAGFPAYYRPRIIVGRGAPGAQLAQPGSWRFRALSVGSKEALPCERRAS
jgi:hypothetical protein